jgi:predicted MFS family arabinose efflux permease
MTALTMHNARTQVRPGRLPARAAFALQVSILVLFLASSSAPTPLYAVYEARWGFSPITVTLVFGVYALAVLTSLLTVGSLSDHIGRRPVLLGAIVVQAIAMLVFATAGGVPALLLARVVQGLATGAAIGALGAGLIDLQKARGTIANGVAPIMGTATGALGSSVLVQYLPAPTRLVYLVIFTVLLMQAIGIVLMAETATPKPGALASLRPEVGLPAGARKPFLLAAPVLVAAWALAGFYLSLGPTLAGLVVGSHSVLLGGLAVFALAGSGGVTVLLSRTTPPRTVMFFGAVALILGVGTILLAIDHSSATAFFVGTALAGVGFGAGFQGGLRTVLPFAALHQRAGVLSTTYVLCFLAMGLPAVVAGVLVTHVGVLTTAREYGVVVMVLAGLALLGMAGRRDADCASR